MIWFIKLVAFLKFVHWLFERIPMPSPPSPPLPVSTTPGATCETDEEILKRLLVGSFRQGDILFVRFPPSSPREGKILQAHVFATMRPGVVPEASGNVGNVALGTTPPVLSPGSSLRN